MIKNIIKYPTPLSLQYGTDVRVFNEELFSLIDDLQDSINENNLVALASFQIGSYFNVIVYKNEDGNFIEMINPVQVSHNGEKIGEETTFYYKDISAKIKRFENISVIYQDKNQKDCVMKFNGELAIVIQRKLDYLFGSTFVDRMSENERQKFEKKLAFGSDVGIDDYCPTTFKRDYFLKVINISMLMMLVALVGSLFIKDKEILNVLWDYEMYTSLGVLALQITYFFYAQYEGKRYSSCVSCQIGNIVATTVISIIRLSVLMFTSYFLI